MSILTDIENYLNSHPDEDLFELLYTLGQFGSVVLDWDEGDNFNPDKDKFEEQLRETVEWFREEMEA